MYTLSKKFRFESAHRLAKGYEGKCANIHGHSWNGELTIGIASLDQYGFGMDFSELKKFTKRIENELDHKLLLFHEDHDIIKLCAKSNLVYKIFHDNPTSEVIAHYIYQEASKYFKRSDCFVEKVSIEETCTSRCVYTDIEQ